MFARRSDATLVTTLPGFRKIVPYLMPGRVDSQVFFQQRINAEPLQAWLAERNAGRPEAERITLLHTFLTAAARVMRLRPETNRFISGFRTYQHREIAITFVVKKRFDDAAEEAEARVVFTGTETPEQTRELVQPAILRARSDVKNDDDRLVEFFAGWPRPILRLVAWTIARLDYHNALPKPLLSAIPLFTSVYLAQLGSIGLDAPLHHLYSYGTASVFLTIGAVHPEPVVDATGAVVARNSLNVGYTLDERISDGYYLARSVELFQRLIEHPWMLDEPLITIDEINSA